MPNTYHQVYLQTVFAVKYRAALIEPQWKPQLCAVIGNLINETGCKTIIVNGVSDHIHCFLGLVPKVAISSMMQSVKAKSSKWVNENNLLPHRFEWQKGFGVFSYSQSHIDNVIRYIQNQEQHHQRQTFIGEYLEMLEKFKVGYDPQYVFHEPE